MKIFTSAALIASLALTFALGAEAQSGGRDYGEADALYAALAEQPHETIEVGGGTIDLVFADGAPGVDRDRVRAWVRTSATAVTEYFGRFPVDHVGLLVIADNGGRIGSGSTYGFRQSAIRIHVGRDATDAAFRRDWVMVHEMTHLALPVVPERSWWLLEGSATYVEPVARVQAGQLSAAQIWGDMLKGMPRGLPGPGDRGLDNTPDHDRIYWGGALFFLIADVRIREQTHGRKGLQDALRAINRESGGNTARWPVDRVMAAGDAATETKVLATLYAQLKDKPGAPDIDALFERLGAAASGAQVMLDDKAPLADVRRAITARRVR